MTVAILEIAGLRLGIEGPGYPALDAFAVSGDAAPEFTVEVALDPGRAPAEAIAPQVRTGRQGPRLFYEGVGSTGEIDLERRRARFLTFPENEHLDGFLRFLVSTLLLERGSLLLHAAGVVWGLRGYVFLGPSGAGKTTIASLAERRGARVLGDEVVAARKVGEQVSLWGTPFGSHGQRAGAPGMAPLAAFCLLEKGQVPSFQKLAAATTARALLRHAIAAPGIVPPATLLDTAVALSRSCPGGTLSFTLDPSFLEVLPR
jgi:hypothetical protein